MDHEQQWLQRIRCEYLEMPSLSLTLPQAQRLWNLDATVCRHLMNALVLAEFLVRRPDGRYVRASGDPAVSSRLNMVKALPPRKNRATEVA